MGYYVNAFEADWVIPTENLDAAYEAMCKLNERDDLKTGGRYIGGIMVDKWFSWMPINYPEVCKDAEEILNHLGFETDTDENGDLRICYYDSKTGAEEHFLAAIAPFSKPDSYIDWRGEDGALWRNIVHNGKMVTLTGRVTFG